MGHQTKIYEYNVHDLPIRKLFQHFSPQIFGETLNICIFHYFFAFWLFIAPPKDFDHVVCIASFVVCISASKRDIIFKLGKLRYFSHSDRNLQPRAWTLAYWICSQSKKISLVMRV